MMNLISNLLACHLNQEVDKVLSPYEPHGSFEPVHFQKLVSCGDLDLCTLLLLTYLSRDFFFYFDQNFSRAGVQVAHTLTQTLVSM